MIERRTHELTCQLTSTDKSPLALMLCTKNCAIHTDDRPIQIKKRRNIAHKCPYYPQMLRRYTQQAACGTTSAQHLVTLAFSTSPVQSQNHPEYVDENSP